MADTLGITLLRHGVTMENERSAYIGWTDSPLSQTGLQQVRAIELPIAKVDLLMASDLKRCLQTAAILFPRVPIFERWNLRELNFGVWEGKTYVQLKDDPLYQAWLNDPFSRYPTDGERFSDFQDRVVCAMETVCHKVVEKQAKETVVVTHGGVIRQWLMHCFGGDFFEWKIPYGGGYRLSGTLDNWREGRVECMSLQEVPIMGKQTGLSDITE